jgi:hypothetical protein
MTNIKEDIMQDSRDKDSEHLRLLSIFHYVLAGLTAIFACLPIMHLVLGIIALVSPEKLADNAGNVPPPFFGWLFIIIGAMAIILGWAYAVCLVFAGRFLIRRKHYIFCLVIAGLSILSFPFGTILGIFTFIVLFRPAVKEMFSSANPG